MAVQILHGVSHADYHADRLPGAPHLSRSIAVKMLKSPLAAWAAHPLLGRSEEESGRSEEESEAMAGGSLLHELLLGGGLGIAECQFDSWRTNAAKAARAEAQANGLLPVLTHKYRGALKDSLLLRARLAEDFEIYLGTYQKEVTILWDDDGVACKLRLDLGKLAAGEIVDLKTTAAEINLGAFERGIIAHGLDMQHHVYTTALEEAFPALGGRVRLDFALCEARAPHDIALVSLAQSMASLGRTRWNRARSRWKECLASGNWPGLGRREPIEAKPWHLSDEFGAAVSGGTFADPDWMKES